MYRKIKVKSNPKFKVKQEIENKQPLPKLTKEEIKQSETLRQTSIYEFLKEKKQSKKKQNIFEK
tara:strand:+ start:7314 stop:7505 length:192 start_codon:yes stop_codon:yes gene_type:complete